jgi:hypothetical protein
VVASFPAVPKKEAIDEVLGVGEFAIFGDDGGKAGALGHFSARNLQFMGEARLRLRPRGIPIITAHGPVAARLAAVADFEGSPEPDGFRTRINTAEVSYKKCIWRRRILLRA